MGNRLGMRLGDLVFDPRLFLFIPSIKALVAARFVELYRPENLKRLVAAIREHRPDNIIFLEGTWNKQWDQLVLQIAADAPKKMRIAIVSEGMSPVTVSQLEKHGFEPYEELVWGDYQFSSVPGESGFFRISPDSKYFVRLGNELQGVKMPVFLKSGAELLLPCIDRDSVCDPVFQQPKLTGFDVFAAGDRRVYPLGKVRDLKPLNGLVSQPPI